MDDTRGETLKKYGSAVQLEQIDLPLLWLIHIQNSHKRNSTLLHCIFPFVVFAPTLQLNWSVHKCIHKSFTKTLVSCSQLSNLLVFSSCHVIYVVQTSCMFNRRSFWPGHHIEASQIPSTSLKTSHNDLPANYSSLKFASFQKKLRD